ncbi:cupin domain [Roseiarcus fermentans]|uniref:Cupin domain n=1 Tax=Roseiarcus fermentans TaxID=1473586 RepID=A0A366FPG8_9HYPH|nr:cupin domain-containing protein [Roseiarcus fermentans]RBP16542.1 cupin domain [Roseiarcus fermentans]
MSVDSSAIPPDDPTRALTVADRDSPGVRHVALVGDTYSILVSGEDTAGAYCLIDMLVPDGGGPPPHRHDFEESFTLLEGELLFTFRGRATTVHAGSTVNIPANAPHVFKNVSGAPARMLCLCVPAGLDAFFVEVGDPLDSRTSPHPELDAEQRSERSRRIAALAPNYRTELLRR